MTPSSQDSESPAIPGRFIPGNSSGQGPNNNGSGIVAIQNGDGTWTVCSGDGNCGTAPVFEPPTTPGVNSPTEVGNGSNVNTNNVGSPVSASVNPVAPGSTGFAANSPQYVQSNTFGGLGEQVATDVGNQLTSDLTQQGQAIAVLEAISVTGSKGEAAIEPSQISIGFGSIAFSVAEYMGRNLTFGGQLPVGAISEFAHKFGVPGAALGTALDAASFGTGGMTFGHLLGNAAVTGGAILEGGPAGATFAGAYFLTDTFYPHEPGASGAAAYLSDYLRLLPETEMQIP
jgi:hypothetical protein